MQQSTHQQQAPPLRFVDFARDMAASEGISFATGLIAAGIYVAAFSNETTENRRQKTALVYLVGSLGGKALDMLLRNK